MDINRGNQPGASPADSLSDTCRAAIAPALARLKSADRGSARERNDRTALARASHFVHWGRKHGFADFAFQCTTQEETGQVLAAYAQDIAEGQGIKGTTQPHVKTIQGYLRAAAAPAVASGRDDPRFLPRLTDFAGKRVYVPLLTQIFLTARKWTPQRRPERQPISVAILSSLQETVPTHPGAELSLSAVVRDAAILGTFTGSRVSEYAQAQLPRGVSFHTVPMNAASGSDGGKPIAFTISDFTFYSAARLAVHHSEAHTAAYLNILFRFTKGVRTFTSRMFAAIPHSAFCPVLAAARVCKRWTLIDPGPSTPLFCFLHTFLAKKPAYLRDTHMTQALRAAALRTHPEPTHLVRQHLAAITGHSLRVFACLCLRLAGWDEDAIAHQLRWDSAAIKVYIRQALFQADDIGATLFKSALAI